MLNTLFKRCQQFQIVRKKQTVNIAASNNDTVVDSAVTVCRIHMKRSDDGRHPCRSLTASVNGCDLISRIQTQTYIETFSINSYFYKKFIKNT